MSLSIHPFSLNPDSTTIDACRAVLSDKEKKRADRFRRAESTRRFTVAHGQLRMVLSEYTGLSPETILFQSGSHGKPYLISGQNPGRVSFNMTHSYDLGIVAICREKEIGVDVEFIKKDRPFMNLARRYFSHSEVEYLESLDACDRRLGFYKIWTLKEAWLKATGLGITGLGLVVTASADNQELRISEWGESCSEMGDTGRPMDQRHFQPAPNYIAAYTRLYSSQIVSTT